MTKDDFNEQCLKEQWEVMVYEGKIPYNTHTWICPSCENQNIELYKRAKLTCITCKNPFVFQNKE